MFTAVAISGGVDSSVAAWLLKNDPETIKKYPQNRIIGVTHWWNELKQSSPELVSRAESVCKTLGIDYHLLDMEACFKEAVISDFSACYLRGETPNPCVRCNEKVRFNAFFKACLKLATEKYDAIDKSFYFCSGHYVRTEKINDKIFLKKAVDPSKDQSYMLYRIPKEVLPHCIFPLGDRTKKEIKQIAGQQGFFGKAIEESQDICFIANNYVSFLREFLDPAKRNIIEKPGQIIDMQGNLLGSSRGFLHYTTGQRKGLGLGNGPWYVSSVDAEKNLVVVGRKDQLGTNSFFIKEANWFITPPDSKNKLECSVQLRYNSKEYSCIVTPSAKQTFAVQLLNKAIASPGQSAVFYDGDIVIGGGIICRE